MIKGDFMNRKEREKIMMNRLSKTYSDSEVKQDKKLSELILEAAKEVDNGDDPNLVSSKLCRLMSLHAVSLNNENKNLPKAALDLYHEIVHQKNIYDGIAATAILTGVWFN